jgi:hypothetical protein
MVNDLRKILYIYVSQAERAMKSLDDSDNLSEKQKEQITVIWETIRGIVDRVDPILPEEFEAYRNIIKESTHFNAQRISHNNAQARYNRRFRAKKYVETGNNVGEPIKRRPRAPTEQEQLLHELHRRLWLIEEKESWRASELIDVISATIPKQSPTAILNELTETKRISHIRATNTYVIENPNIRGNETTNQTTEEPLTDTE